MSLDIDIVETVADRFAAAPAVVGLSLADTAEALAATLLDRARALASGGAVRRRSGELAESLAVDVSAGAGGFVARLSDAAPYASILEYGGEIPAHVIAPKNAKALKFRGGAVDVFAAAVRVPAVHIEAHSFLRAALDGEAQAIRRALVDDVGDTLASLFA